MRNGMRTTAARRRMRGQSTIEYLVVVMVGVLVLVLGTDPPIQKLAKAVREYYTDYSYAISVSSMPNCFNEFGAGPVKVGIDKCPDLKNPEWPVDIEFDY